MDVSVHCKGTRKRGSHKGQGCHRTVLTFDPETGTVSANCPECGERMSLLVSTWVIQSHAGAAA